MAFLDRLMTGQPTNTPLEAALACAVAAIMVEGQLRSVERQLISVFRDEFPLLSQVSEDVFAQTLEAAIRSVNQQQIAADLPGFVRTRIAPAIANPADRLAAYRYVYALAMADLNLDDNEGALLAAMKSGFNLGPADCYRMEQAALDEFRGLHQALAAAVLGLMVVSADGRVTDQELDEMRSARTLLEPIAHLDATQFGLVFDLALNIHDRFLLDPANRAAFLNNIVAPMLNTTQLHHMAFSYAAHIATSDGDIAQAEADMLKSLLAVLNMSDAEGETIFNHYFSRIRTIDGRPR